MDTAEELVWKESFFKENFNVDSCLSKYTLKSDLETLRNDLKKYGNELHQQMAEILKTETEAIVNLAEYLTNLNSRIDDLSLPISQLREEIKTLYDLIKNAQISYNNALENIKSNNTQHNYLNLKNGIIASALYINEMILTHEDDLFDDSIILERAVNKYSFEFNYLEAFGKTADLEEISIIVGKKLTNMVNKFFLKAVKNNDESVILRCLRMYENLGQQNEAEKTYQINIVRPCLKHLFTETYLENCSQDVSKIYDEALDFIDSKLTTLLNVLEKNNELKSFNFILNSFWLEVDKLSREGLPNLAAPGNPELFQKRFKSTWNFLVKISEKCGDGNLIYSHKSFQDHIKRFNLPVYFEIRFQQIAGQFESDAIIKSGPKIYIDNNEISCNLKITLTLWKTLTLLFSPEVFINNLVDQFLKLSMLLLSRYLKWFETALEDRNSFPEGAEDWVDFIIKSIKDLNIINDLIGSKSTNNIFSIVPSDVQSILVKIFQLNSDLISQVTSKLQNHLISLKSSECYSHLQNVAAIPRLYRRTNRSAPKDASNYMVEALQPILKFHNKYSNEMKNEIQYILDSVISNNTKQYQSLVDEVLRSVCKTEESLRRLKNRNVQISETVSEDTEGSDTMSDEMKIREQIKLDVCYFIDNLNPIATSDARKLMNELKRKTC